MPVQFHEEMVRRFYLQNKKKLNFVSVISKVLTSERSVGVVLFLCPLMISNKMIPKLYTSHFSVRYRSLEYSGAVYPLQITKKKKRQSVEVVCL
jgi:hypothetical protein